MYEEGRKLYTEEINAAVRGAKAAGATEIVVMDCHGAGGGWTFNSLVPELLDPDCEWVVQDQWTGYTAFLEQGCDAALFVGMHAMAGHARRRAEPHVSGQAWQNLWFNGTLVGETGINAALCGTLGLPGAAGHRRRGDLRRGKRRCSATGSTTVAVKQGLGRYSARQIPPVRARADDRGRARSRRSTDLKASRRTTRAAPADQGRVQGTDSRPTSSAASRRRILDDRRIRFDRRLVVGRLDSSSSSARRLLPEARRRRAPRRG